MQANKRSIRSEGGFTLIELLTTVTIIGILSAIATSQFQAYTQRSLSARAENDLRAAVTAEEAVYAEEESYVACSGVACHAALPGYILSLDVQLNITTRDGGQIFDAVAFHPNGDKTLSYSSETGEFTSVPR